MSPVALGEDEADHGLAFLIHITEITVRALHRLEPRPRHWRKRNTVAIGWYDSYSRRRNGLIACRRRTPNIGLDWTNITTIRTSCRLVTDRKFHLPITWPRTSPILFSNVIRSYRAQHVVQIWHWEIRNLERIEGRDEGWDETRLRPMGRSRVECIYKYKYMFTVWG